jgi:hypothetical protein
MRTPRTVTIRAGQRAGLEHPLFVENAIVRQIDLETQRDWMRPASSSA